MPARKNLFDDIDSMDADRYAAHLAEDVVMRFGNAEPVHGRQAVRDTWASFCTGIAGVSHDLIDQWEEGPATIAESNVTYTRNDGSTVTVPVVTIYRSNRDDGLIDDYRIFIDLAPLFAEG
jgi:ketosteroid isomerase-like protein